MRILLYIILVIMSLVTMLGLLPSIASFLFAGGSDGLMDFVFANVWIQISLLIIFGIGVVTYKLKFFKYQSLFLLLIFFLWFLSGRMVSLFADGKLNSGWFYLTTDQIDICKNQIDCDKVFYYETSIEKLMFWRIKIKNKEVDTVVFIGPIIWIKTIELFEDKFQTFKSANNKKDH